MYHCGGHWKEEGYAYGGRGQWEFSVILLNLAVNLKLLLKKASSVYFSEISVLRSIWVFHCFLCTYKKLMCAFSIKKKYPQYHLIPIRTTTIKQRKKCGEIRPVCTAGGNVNGAIWKTVGRFLKKFKNRTILWCSHPTSGHIIYKGESARDICTPIYIVALFRKACNMGGKQTRCPRRDDWMKKM